MPGPVAVIRLSDALPFCVFISSSLSVLNCMLLEQSAFYSNNCLHIIRGRDCSYWLPDDESGPKVHITVLWSVHDERADVVLKDIWRYRRKTGPSSTIWLWKFPADGILFRSNLMRKYRIYLISNSTFRECDMTIIPLTPTNLYLWSWMQLERNSGFLACRRNFIFFGINLHSGGGIETQTAKGIPLISRRFSEKCCYSREGFCILCTIYVGFFPFFIPTK